VQADSIGYKVKKKKKKKPFTLPAKLTTETLKTEISARIEINRTIAEKTGQQSKQIQNSTPPSKKCPLSSGQIHHRNI
jgi:hypothetical protein